jgi:rhodanese-related sulfurtransferase/transcriptional regulator with XRE-family HTH domain
MVRTLDVREAEALLAAGGVDVVDVREPNEWATGHLPGARLVPLGTLRSDPASASLRDKVLFVCARGPRSMNAAQLAESRGIGDVYSLDGGTMAWAAAGLPIVKPEPPAPKKAAVEEEPEGELAPEPELDAVVSENFRTLRKERGWTLDMLAGLSGVSRHTLGQIEIGRSAPSLGTLWKIARAFEVPFSALLARPESTATRVLRQAGAKRLPSVDGRFSSRALFSPDDHGKVEFYELWLAGHGREDAEAHAPGTRENLVVTSGRLVLEIAKDRYELAKGDAIVFVADVPHAYVNPASEECWMNLVMTYR